MIKIRKAAERGSFDHGWLKTHHTFSFSEYYDPDYMHFRHLRVINEDTVAPGEGFGTHPHQDMEILTYVIRGALEHSDSMGNGSVIQPGDIQRMSAGTGVTHSEFNHSRSEPVHFLQIWIVPDQKGHEPSYEQIHVAESEKRDLLRLVASRNGRQGSIQVNQDMMLFAAVVSQGRSLAYRPESGRYLWVQVVRGQAKLNGLDVAAGDGAGLSAEGELLFSATEESEILLFDLA